MLNSFYFALILSAASVVQLTESVIGIIQFQKVQRCPTVNATRRLPNPSTELHCSEVCGENSRCNAFHFDPVNRTCYLGDACSTLTQWTAGVCDSYMHSSTSARDTRDASPGLFHSLQMKLLYRFKKSGLLNEVDPRQLCLTAHGVTFGSDGAEFKGSPSSYLITETPGFKQYLDQGNSFSFFVQVRHAMSAGVQTYHSIQQCSLNENAASTFSQSSTFVESYSCSTQGVMRHGKSQDFLAADGNCSRVSVGFAFNQTAHQHFYFNQTLMDSDSLPTLTSARIVDPHMFQCLRLGFSSSGGSSLNGTMQCYGMSTRVLGLSEFILLDAYCSD